MESDLITSARAMFAECDTILLARSILKECEGKGLHTGANFRPSDKRNISLPLWSNDYYCNICSMMFRKDHLSLIFPYEKLIDSQYPNPHQFFGYCDPAFPNNLYKIIDQRRKKIDGIKTKVPSAIKRLI